MPVGSLAMNDPQPHPNLIKTYVLPGLWLFALPLFGLWFASHAVSGFDAEFFDLARASLLNDPSIGELEQQAGLAFYEANPVSAICAGVNPELAQMRAEMSDLCGRYTWLEYIGWLSWLCIGFGLLASLVSAGAAGLAFVSTRAQVAAFALGWNTLRVTSAVQAVGQGALGVLLSYWVTAYFMNIYVPKLILIVAVLAGMAVWAVVMGIFKRIHLALPVSGTLLTEQGAPELWARVRRIAADVGTEPPSHIIAGIDDNFFVTEGTVDLHDHELTGRSLFVSLSLLRVMSQAEADAVLAHEMAHFHGGDTARSRKLVPMQARFVNYLAALREGGITYPVYLSMLSFYAMFTAALSKSSREREHMADTKAVAITSPNALGTALMKAVAYAGYRGRVEGSLFGQNEALADIRIAEKVRSGFAEYAGSNEINDDLLGRSISHPFDSHPPLRDRLAHVGATVDPSAPAESLLAEVSDSWVGLVPNCDEIEGKQWDAYEQQFKGQHEFSLALRYKPEGAEQTALVEKYFPMAEFPTLDGEMITVSWRGVTFDGWAEDLNFHDLTNAGVEDKTFGGKVLVLTRNELPKLEIPLKRLDDAGLLDAVGRYWQRHQIAMSQAATSPVA